MPCQPRRRCCHARTRCDAARRGVASAAAMAVRVDPRRRIGEAEWLGRQLCIDNDATLRFAYSQRRPVGTASQVQQQVYLAFAAAAEASGRGESPSCAEGSAPLCLLLVWRSASALVWRRFMQLPHMPLRVGCDAFRCAVADAAASAKVCML